MLGLNRIVSKSKGLVYAALACCALWFSSTAHAQTWVWTPEVVDTYGRSMSLAADAEGNIHISYGGSGGLTYGFRPFGEKSRWFVMTLGGGVSYTDVALDRQGNPYICATYLSLPLRFARFSDKEWKIQNIAPEDSMAVQMACGVAISADGTPQVSWYRYSDSPDFKHLKYAVLKDGAWLMRTLDFDAQTGKWHTMVLNSQGNPCISYDAFVKGVLKLDCWDGKNWNISVPDSRGAHGSDYSLGMGSSLVFDAQGKAHISYYTDTAIRHAFQDGQGWKVETVEQISPIGGFVDYRSSILFDKDGALHVSYEDGGVAKHAYWDGTRWRVQVIAPAGGGELRSRFSWMTIDSTHDILYLAYRDAADGALKVAVGRKVESPQTASSEKKAEKN
jgi:hypothetical protein